MNKFILSIIAALSIFFTVVSPVSHAASIDNVDDVADTVGDVSDFIGYLQDFIDVVNLIIDTLPPGSSNIFDEDFYNSPAGQQCRDEINSVFNGVVKDICPFIPSVDWCDFYMHWNLGGKVLILDKYGAQVADFCEENSDIIRQFDQNYVIPYFKDYADFASNIYGSYALPAPDDPGDVQIDDTMAFIGDGAGSFISGVLTPVGAFCINNEICLAFLSVSILGLGVRLLCRSVGAFGHGR